MGSESENPVMPLYILARGDGELMINEVQREAILRLGELSIRGNSDAKAALIRLYRLPDYHILLREMVAASLGTHV